MGLRPVLNPTFNPGLSYWKGGLAKSEVGGSGTEWQEDKLDRTAHVRNHREDLKAQTLCCFSTFRIFHSQKTKTTSSL